MGNGNHKKRLEDLLDTFVVMESILGTKWDFFHKSEESKIVQYLLEPKFEMTPMNKVEIYLNLSKHNGMILVEVILGREYKEKIRTIKSWVKTHGVNKLFKKTEIALFYSLQFGLRDVDDCSDFFEVLKKII